MAANMDEFAKKRQLIEGLESSRSAPSASREKSTLQFVPFSASNNSRDAEHLAPDATDRELQAEILRLVGENKELRAANSMLEENALRLENQALACWRDAETAKRLLAQKQNCATSANCAPDKLRAELAAKETENQLLVQALIDSENMVTRLVAELTAFFARRVA